jgi:hypothetical protein
MRLRGCHRPVALLTAAALAASGCTSYRWKVIPLKELDVAGDRLRHTLVRLDSPQGVVVLELQRLVHPYALGVAQPGSGPVLVDLRRARRIEVFPGATDAGGRKRDVAANQDALAAEPLAGRPVKLHLDRGSVRILAASLAWPWLEGTVQDGDAEVAVDLRRVTDAQVRETNVAGTVGRSLLGTVGVLAVIFLIVALTKESCPIVYVDRGRGWELVGEAYAGAAFRSIQRDDLLPLAPLDQQRTLRVRLRNEARETQYTDHAELVLVDQADDQRVLSSFDGRLLSVGQAEPPVRATDLRGRDVRDLLAAEDGQPWQTDLIQAAAEKGVALRDGVVAEFEAPSGPAVLELVGGNTPWLDLAFGRFFAAMGDRLPRYLARGNDSASGLRIRRWREREGVDLAVDLWRGGRWQRMAIVPTVGPVALRQVAVPLPATSGRVRVRLSGGLGFWRFDRLALSAARTDAVSMTALAPRAARGVGGRDQRAALSARDGVYDALEQLEDALDLEFDLPPPAPGRRRVAFLSSNGYYNVHPPLQPQWLPGTLRAVRDQRGAMARLTLDLARAYSEPAPAAGAVP